MTSKSKLQTQKLAAGLAGKILKRQASGLRRRASVIALLGELGAGKTTFTQGFARALGVESRVASPTFIIFRKHEIGECGLHKHIKHIFHFDLYRIQKPQEILKLGFKKIINDPDNIVLIEWPEKIKGILPKNTIWVHFEHGKSLNQRNIKISK
ncbi:MAG: tRNA (adenosine(37)-N6)-threonylcarbamoyltransferase complex ATPase subunit type 1 TsaE [Candidatus Pacebacteria bacterium]|nr:tRNA (adenosine(37)-N6)-threonylcarbamoyltransferase complex ATPase subunit type 1 TsaE [Candidatus Paceibacterota bacterium]